ncbi:MAG: MotA/TolQ/ExbB proton channel family protein [Bacteroidaceae bacterium]|nr:MotA/TolQ/ExbB proton channel family protein [Bacteroidaceae bacterium]
MKKVFAIIALMGVFTFGMTQSVFAQDEEAAVDTAAAVEQVDTAAVEEEAAEEVVAPAEEEELEEVGMYKQLKTKFIEGSAGWMFPVALALIIGLAFCIERIVYLALSDVKTDKMIAEVEKALDANDVEKAKDVCRNTRGPIASIFYQGLMRLKDGADSVEKAVVAYGAVQASNLEKGCSWITLFIAMAPSLGFLGTVVGMVAAFDAIQEVGDISPTVVAGGMKVALITTIFGIIVALILQLFYNYILAKIEGITAEMENSTISLLDIVAKNEAKK